MATDKVRVDLTGTRGTMFLTLCARARDAQSPRPILGDQLAVATLERLDYQVPRGMDNAGVGASVAARAKFLDGWTRAFLDDHPRCTVLHLAAGLDARAWRVDPGPGVTWIDLDYPEVVELRRRLLPERTGVQLMAASVTEPGWLPDLPDADPVLVVAEGLTMYLHPEDGHALFRRITDHFATGELAFDTQNRAALTLQRISPIMRGLGAQFSWAVDDPYELVREDSRLRLLDAVDVLYAPGAEELPWPTRLTAALIRPFPRLRHLGMYLRYAF